MSCFIEMVFLFIACKGIKQLVNSHIKYEQRLGQSYDICSSISIILLSHTQTNHPTSIYPNQTYFCQLLCSSKDFLHRCSVVFLWLSPSFCFCFLCQSMENKSKVFGETQKMCTFASDMSSNECISQFTPNLFWDVHPSDLKMDENQGYIIQRVLEYGQMNDWLLINRYYGLDQIVEECKKLRSLNPVCLAFICTISHTKEEDYRCYHFKQSCPTLWNS